MMADQPGEEPRPTLSHSPTVTATRAFEYGRYSELMAQAVQVLTCAARLTWSSPGADAEPTTARVDWAEFVTLALAGAAANVGSIEGALNGRPGRGKRTASASC